MTEQEDIRYAGFWIRTGAAIIDSVALFLIIAPVLYIIYGPEYFTSDEMVAGVWDFALNYLLPAVAVILFWTYKSATPGKIILDLKIVDASTGAKPSIKQFIGRYLGYYLSTLALMLGLIWVAFDKRKQGWHDKLAGTVVIHDPDLI